MFANVKFGDEQRTPGIDIVGGTLKTRRDDLSQRRGCSEADAEDPRNHFEVAHGFRLRAGAT